MEQFQFSQIIFNLHHIDLGNEKLLKITEHKNENDVTNYLELLIKEIYDEKTKRKFNISSKTTEVFVSILNILQKSDFELNTEIIANRLLREEIRIQDKIKHLKDIKKGSILQCYFQMNGNPYIIITKVDHNPFLDENELKKRIGLPYNKKVIKAALFRFNMDNNVEQIYVLDSNAKISEYWWKDFLELVEIYSDEANSENSFNSIDKYLNKKIKKKISYRSYHY